VTAVWYRFRATFGQRAAGYVAVVLLLGLLGGVALASVAGARRTVSAFPRYRRSTNPSDIQVDAGQYEPAAVDAINRLPEVARTATYVAFYAVPLGPDGEPDSTFFDAESVGSLDGLYFSQDRFTPTEGRLPDPARADEMAVNLNAARLHHLHVGQRLDLGVYTRAAVEEPTSDAPPTPADRLTVTIVGIGAFNDEVVQDEIDRNVRFLHPQAFTAREKDLALYFWTGAQLKRGAADVEAFKGDFVRLLDEGSPEFFRVNSAITTQAQRAVRPLGVALGVFGALAGVATVLLAGQALARALRTDRDDLGALRAMGAGPLTTSAMGLPGAGLSVVLGTLLAGLVAWAVSALTPIGPVRAFEVHRGLSVDWLVFGLGAAVFLAALGAVALLVGLRQAPHRLEGRAALAPRRSTTAGAAATAGFPAPAVVGLRLALEPGEGRTAVPVRAAMGGAVVAVVGLVAALVFGRSLDALVRHPDLYGWGWQATIVAGAGYSNVDRDKAHEVLDSDPDVAAWSGVYFGSLEIDGRNVPALGVEPGAALSPPVRSGHAVRGPDEIVLGATTLSDLHKRVGEFVSVGRGDHPTRMRVVGTAVLPTVGIGHGAYTSLGLGAALPFEKLPGVARSTGDGTIPGPNAIFIRLHDHSERSPALRRLGRVVRQLGDEAEISLLPVQRPAEIVNYSRTGSTPAVLAGGLTIAVLLSLGVTLAAGVRRRRRDLALLKSLGFTRGQLSAAVGWQATITMLVGVALGVPLGSALGRWLWGRFARQLAVLARPSMPVGLLAGLGAGLLLLAVLVAVVPARAAGRTPAAAILRSE
jgi:hypothetical protein